MTTAALRKRRDDLLSMPHRVSAKEGLSSSFSRTCPDPFITGPYAWDEEPLISDLLQDDLMRSMMSSDGVGDEILSALIDHARVRLAG
ncbi:hypothetical protein [Rhodospirillum rubrum]|uniref:Uncharacterized protein n=1 Tax=Rhodospirillum rubrum (strain ATCC 11170 / ATH 1.1.1 / DSM 467 / LMG 4362 / NCIMB 8255 / S1) TaxID=269796 RepID=Q2RYB9_RHORT|nr:hypothetical protein [Rhodospirillum rubrum]ABC20876.1 hypothetical protein Rru_A0071 [Rhodospirillum rubrum ATCC 11170]MBK5952434.1 hypothetical protein [Rhodospirillum rubrum]QXG80578.1 hypothetical protein KUL73_00365 [Rhodospirillum rubrum]HAP98902.1 hypothetical protein [Rhodospirillum rubrum]HCF17942.1 hypothetical protein [Rhodospirillum rubrum]